MRYDLDTDAIFHRGFERFQRLAATFPSYTTGGLARIATLKNAPWTRLETKPTILS
jgi:hypothetical protein